MNDLDLAHKLIAAGKRQEGYDALCRHFGLVAGETVLTHNGYVGVFRELLNYYEGEKPWVAVTITLRPDGVTRGGGHFYHGWEKVENS